MNNEKKKGWSAELNKGNKKNKGRRAAMKNGIGGLGNIFLRIEVGFLYFRRGNEGLFILF